MLYRANREVSECIQCYVLLPMVSCISVTIQTVENHGADSLTHLRAINILSQNQTFSDVRSADHLRNLHS